MLFDETLIRDVFEAPCKAVMVSVESDLELRVVDGVSVADDTLLWDEMLYDEPLILEESGGLAVEADNDEVAPEEKKPLDGPTLRELENEDAFSETEAWVEGLEDKTFISVVSEVLRSKDVISNLPGFIPATTDGDASRRDGKFRDEAKLPEDGNVICVDSEVTGSSIGEAETLGEGMEILVFLLVEAAEVEVCSDINSEAGGRGVIVFLPCA